MPTLLPTNGNYVPCGYAPRQSIYLWIREGGAEETSEVQKITFSD